MAGGNPGGLPEHVHFLGVGGAGLSGAARILAARGHRVSGHDAAASRLLDGLGDLIEITLGPSSAELLPESAGLVVRSAAIGEADPQIVAARELGLPVVKYAELLPRLAAPDRTLAVAGTHGKTTTGWMLWHGLDGLGNRIGGPLAGALIGGLDQRLATNGLPGSEGGFFAVEACEYDRSFHALHPHAALITNVDADHLDYYGTFERIVESFETFAAQVAPDGLLVLGADVPASIEAAARCDVWRLGRDVTTRLLGEQRGAFRFEVSGPGFRTEPLQLDVPGRFNVDNATAALALGVGVSGARDDAAATAFGQGLERFRGVARRFERWGRFGGVEVVHDYAHHPTEVRATLEAARRFAPGRELCVLFQPHQHSRTARFQAEFVESLRGADAVWIADVYGARKHIDGARFAGAKELIEGLRACGVRSERAGGLDTCAATFAAGLPKRALALVIGAGTIDQVQEELLRELAVRSPAGRPPRT